MLTNNINSIPKNKCFGCHACENICPKKCIKMIADIEGFKYPHIGDACINCGLCLKVCPVINSHKNTPNSVLGCVNTDAERLQSSSSGGVFIELARNVISNQGVAYGAAYCDNFSSVAHQRITNCEDLSILQGSKYVQSNIDGVFDSVEQDLIANINVLFSGTPCQVAGLKNFLRKDYDNLITADLVCHGIPSPKVFSDYIKAITQKYGPIVSINMKDKTKGWGHQIPKIVTIGDIIVPESYSSLWNKIYYSRVVLRPSCFNCQFASKERCGDITIGDFWGVEKIKQELDTQNGISLVLVNTQKGQSLFERITHNFDSFESNLYECTQPALEAAIPGPIWRTNFWRNYLKFGFVDTTHRYWNISFKAANIIKINRFLKRFL